MKLSHQQLLQAVREIAPSGEPFSSADVRKHLGVPTKDKQALNQFHTAFRNFQKAAPEIHKLPNNRYQMIEGATALPIAVEELGLAPSADEAVFVPELAVEPIAHVVVESQPMAASIPDAPVAAPGQRHERVSARSWRERARVLTWRVVHRFSARIQSSSAA